MKTKFKALMYNGIFVDANILEKGIYESPKPFLYSMETTIETLIKQAQDIQDKYGVHHVSDTYLENLRQCELVTVTLTIEK